MKAMRYEQLPDLPDEIKGLVREGVYSLYLIQSPTARFLLVTKNRDEFYFLSDTGVVVPNPGHSSISDIKITDAVSLSGRADGDTSATINFA